MLNKYILSCLQKNKLEYINTRFTVSDLKDLLSKETFEDFASKRLESIIESKSVYVKCPTCSIAMEIQSPTESAAPEEATALKKLRHPRTSKPLEHTEMRHYRENRIKCRNQSCLKDFCSSCLITPYHIGNTCQSYVKEVNTPECRFCGILLNKENMTKNPISAAFANVCTLQDCVEKMKISSPKTLLCGHVSCGIKQEIYGELLVYGYVRCYINVRCPSDLMNLCVLFYKEPYELPCLHKNCKLRSNKIKDTDTDNCLLCYEQLGHGPCIEMPCHHVFHYQCIRRKIESGSPRLYIEFGFMNCIICRAPMAHPALQDIIEPLRNLQKRIEKEAVTMLEKRKNDDINNASHRYYGKPVEYAMMLYAFYECYQCKETYFGGSCEKDYYDSTRKDFVCKDCQQMQPSSTCNFHSQSHWIYKCRYCYNKAKHCIDKKLHICDEKELSLYKDGKNIKLIEEYTQCSGLKDEINKLIKNEKWDKWSRAQKDRELYKLRCKELCSLKLEHPPNGFEFVIGCSQCNEIELYNMLKEKVKNKTAFMKDMDSVLTFAPTADQHILDENGILFFLGTKGTKDKNQYENPAKVDMIVVNSSELMNDSASCLSMVGRECVKCVTKENTACWFTVDFVDKYVNPTHYILTHYNSVGNYLRNWSIEGSVDGKKWFVLRLHFNDLELQTTGQSCKWALHDYNCAYRLFRIKQTGPNSDNNYFFAISGFELYGTLYNYTDDMEMKNKFANAYKQQQKMRKLSRKRFYECICNGKEGMIRLTYCDDSYNNGILHFLGTKGEQNVWTNPTFIDEVATSSTILMKDSVEISCFVGRDTVRLITKPEDNPWMQIDFKDKLIEPSCYTLRHWVLDIGALRNWVLEASNDSQNWKIIKKHQQDDALQERGATHTWTLPHKGAYRFWRIRQTGLNSNEHKYLACSGIEFHGTLISTTFDLFQCVLNVGQCEKILNSLVLLKKCTFQQTDDENGVLYFIGTRGGKAKWVNPGSRKWVKSQASSLMKDSELPSALCGRISVRCVTVPYDNSWMKIDLKCLYVTPTHYSLRHYISWNTEAVRNWVFEASFDDQIWIGLRSHINDANLDHKGAIATWEIKSKGGKYRCFRIRQIGLNSNKHKHLACSGIEIYGDVYSIYKGKSTEKKEININDLMSRDEDMKLQLPWNMDGVEVDEIENNLELDSHVLKDRSIAIDERARIIEFLSDRNGYPFYYLKDFDDNGILHFLGTKWRIVEWRNPADIDAVCVTSSRMARDSLPCSAICGKDVVRCVLMAERNNWFCIDFKNIYIELTHYSLRHYSSWDNECLRNWVLEGSNNRKQFKIIKQHRKDESLRGKGSTKTWEVDSKGKRYRVFRIRQTKPNSNKHWWFACSGVEFYGMIYFKPT